MTEKPLNMGILLKKRVSLICSTLRSRSLDYKHRLTQEVLTNQLPLFYNNIVTFLCMYTYSLLIVVCHYLVMKDY